MQKLDRPPRREAQRPVASAAQEADDNWGMREEWNESVDRHSARSSPALSLSARVLIYRR